MPRPQPYTEPIGANGVILITTKKGRMEKTNINVSFKYGIAFANESTRCKMLNASQYMEYAQEAWVNAGYPISAFPLSGQRI